MRFATWLKEGIKVGAENFQPLLDNKLVLWCYNSIRETIPPSITVGASLLDRRYVEVTATFVGASGYFLFVEFLCRKSTRVMTKVSVAEIAPMASKIMFISHPRISMRIEQLELLEEESANGLLIENF